MRRIREASIFTMLLVLAVAGCAAQEAAGGANGHVDAAPAGPAAAISGTVTNATTGKPAAGTAVTLVDPMGGMAEVATTKADSQGHFSFKKLPAAQGPRLARAERGGVNYFKMVTPGSTNVDLSVYDASPKVEGISGQADVVRMQTDGGQLQVMELFAISNNSNPPRTLASSSTFEFVVPDGAQLAGAQAEAPNGQPITVQPAPAKEKNHYAFSFALKPGETRLQVAYDMPYSGKASFTPKFIQNFEHYVLVLPASMSFVANDPKQFQAMMNQPGSNVQVSLRAQAGADLGYSISGKGSFPDDNAQGGEGSSGGAMGGGTTADNRPGGGLGKPIDAPDGLAKYRWYILAGLLTLLVGGGIWTHERTKLEEAESGVALAVPPATGAAKTPVVGSARAKVAAAPEQAPGNLLLSALKEELFALEVERQQGKLTAEEYDKARNALEQTLQRALSRSKS